MIRLRSIAAVGALALLAFTSAAHAQCENLNIDQFPNPLWNSSDIGDYNPFDSIRFFQQENIDVKKGGTGTCDLFVTFGTGNSGNFNQREMTKDADILTYNIYDAPNINANILKDLAGGAQAQNVLPGAITQSQGQQLVTVSFHWTIDPEQVVPDVDYIDNVTYTLYEGTVASNTQRDQTSSDVKSLSVQRVVELSLVDTGAPFDALDTNQTVNFGVLSLGLTRSFDLLVRTSTTGYRVEFQSTNASIMKIDHPTDTSTVPYTVTVGGLSRDLSSGLAVEVASATIATPAEGDRYAVQFTIGDPGAFLPAGKYQDEIIVTVSAQ